VLIAVHKGKGHPVHHIITRKPTTEGMQQHS